MRQSLALGTESKIQHHAVTFHLKADTQSKKPLPFDPLHNLLHVVPEVPGTEIPLMSVEAPRMGKAKQQLKPARQLCSPSTTPCKKCTSQILIACHSPAGRAMCHLLAPSHNNPSNSHWHSRGDLGPHTPNRQNATDNH